VPLPLDLRVLACCAVIGGSGLVASHQQTADLESEMRRIASAPSDSADFVAHKRAVDSAVRARGTRNGLPPADRAIPGWRDRWFGTPRRDSLTPRADARIRSARTRSDTSNDRATPRHATGEPITPPIDVDRASAADLERLPRVGPALAQRIVAHRDRCGPFATLEQLDEVPGVGPALLRTIAGSVTFSGTRRPSHASGCTGGTR
jgi:competence ComEA-like helix-hairpin-helix protein